ncbi:hypothetical protein [Burkholderia sp. S-53]|uniref:hypothetical protein n=1 Tax=Burkholderia sp. S-53 TaxID=2906514 RepID=UPI0021D01D08|nr:hypothetical protein [Burkholderia sp. S-53]UXU85638.1 hypothetical protein LXM88_04540 [Burkholderia sp. S-53]
MPISVTCRLLAATSLLQCFRSASYSSRLALLSLASEFALLMAEEIKADSAAELFDRIHDCPGEIPFQMTCDFDERIPNSDRDGDTPFPANS